MGDLEGLLGYKDFALAFGGDQGFCHATAQAWRAGAREEAGAEIDYVFYLEHDFRFVRTVDLKHLAEELDRDPSLAQMALMRNAVNAKEIAAGGLFESREEEYRREWTNSPYRNAAEPWLDHSSYFTTNPSLMTRRFMVQNPWPDYEEECEGKFGLDLIDRGYHFGVWARARSGSSTSARARERATDAAAVRHRSRGLSNLERAPPPGATEGRGEVRVHARR